MLRLLVVLLLLVNGLYFAWSRGDLAAYGWAPIRESHPERLKQQIKPEVLRVMAEPEGQLASCQQVGPLESTQQEPVERVLKTHFPAGAWHWQAQPSVVRWVVYMGPYASAAVRDKKKQELQSLNVRYETTLAPALEPGLALGRFETRPQAVQHLSKVGTQGVHSARVVQEGSATPRQLLVVNASEEVLRTRLPQLKPLLSSTPWRSCQPDQIR